MVDLLKLEPTDRVLEVGSGPGVALALAAERVPHGHVTGLDLSPVMVAQARRRNRTAVAAGRVDVRQGDAASLPFPAGSFSKIYTINCLPFWPSVPDGLAEVRRLLAPDGLVVVAVRLYREGVGRANPSAYGFTDEQLAELAETTEHAGLRLVGTIRRRAGNA